MIKKFLISLALIYSSYSIAEVADYSVSPTPIVQLHPEVVVSNKQLECLATNIYYESRGEVALGMLAVAQVTLNRVISDKFRNTICGVVFRPKQFSWTSNTKRMKYDDKSMSIALKALYEVHELSNFTSLYFHNKTVRPKWKLTRLRSIGNHIFYH